MLTLKDINFSYGREKILRDFSAEIQDGEFLVIIGPNGSGKTTLLKLITKILQPSSGEILLDGTDIRQIAAEEYARKTAFLPSNIEPAFSYTVWEFIAMGRYPHTGRYGKLSDIDKKRVEEAVEQFDINRYRKRTLWELSDGEKQRVLLAQAVVQDPSILILDEPTSHLDIGHQLKILDIIRTLNRKRITIVSVLHDLNLASEYSTRMLLMRDGEIFSQGPPEQVVTYQNIERVYETRVLVYKNPVSGRPCVFGIPSSG